MADTKQYLRGLIEHYEFLLGQTPQQEWVNTHKELITEEKFKCQYKLHQIVEADIEGMIMANACACPFQGTNLI